MPLSNSDTARRLDIRINGKSTFLRTFKFWEDEEHTVPAEKTLSDFEARVFKSGCEDAEEELISSTLGDGLTLTDDHILEWEVSVTDILALESGMHQWEMKEVDAEGRTRIILYGQFHKP